MGLCRPNPGRRVVRGYAVLSGHEQFDSGGLGNFNEALLHFERIKCNGGDHNLDVFEGCENSRFV